MGATITQKILARAAGRVSAEVGETIRCRPANTIAYDFPGVTDSMFAQVAELGIDQVVEPERHVLFIDHFLPSLAPKVGRNPAQEDVHHNVTRAWAKKNGIKLHEGIGIGHQVCAELGYGLPGDFLIHFDGHVSQLGAQGALALGVRRELIVAWVLGELWLEVPASQRFNLTGELSHGVLSRDLLHHIIGKIDADGCVDAVMEFAGTGASTISLDGRAALCGMSMFTGAVSAIFNPDATSLAYARTRAKREFEPLWSDPDASYEAEHDFDLSEIEPQVVFPPSARNTRPISEAEGTEVQQGYIGSCINGRLEDLRAAAEILSGAKVKKGFRLLVVPSSRDIRERAEEEGLLDVIRRAGAEIHDPSCDFCNGFAAPMEAGESRISTGPLNVRGRMGSTEASIYMGSPYTVAAASIEGRIVDPRSYLGRRT